MQKQWLLAAEIEVWAVDSEGAIKMVKDLLHRSGVDWVHVKKSKLVYDPERDREIL